MNIEPLNNKRRLFDGIVNTDRQLTSFLKVETNHRFLIDELLFRIPPCAPSYAC